MRMFLKFLIVSLKSINGQKNSGLGLFNALVKQEKAEFMKKSGEVRIKSFIE